MQYACKLLTKFVEQLVLLSHANIVYNIYSLIHIAADVKNFGHLDAFSTFKFENFLAVTKSRIQDGNLSLNQIVSRLQRVTHYANSLSNIRRTQRNNLTRQKDSCTKLKSGAYVFVKCTNKVEISITPLLKKVKSAQDQI